MAKIPMVDYLVLGKEPHLTAQECKECGALFFDRRNACAHCGGAQISSVHANFIVNNGSATAADVAALIRRAQDTVRDHSGIELVPEVRIVGRPG